MKTRRNLFKEAEVIYNQGGLSAVIDFARQEKVQNWDYCPACDTEVPNVENTCLACGQPLE